MFQRVLPLLLVLVVLAACGAQAAVPSTPATTHQRWIAALAAHDTTAMRAEVRVTPEQMEDFLLRAIDSLKTAQYVRTRDPDAASDGLGVSVWQQGAEQICWQTELTEIDGQWYVTAFHLMPEYRPACVAARKGE